MKKEDVKKQKWQNRRLKILLIEYGMKVKELAEKIHLSKFTIYDIMRGRRKMQDYTIKDIAKVFNVDESFILGETHKLRK